MTNQILKIAKPQMVLQIFPSCFLCAISFAMSFALASSVQAADTSTEVQATSAVATNYKVTESISIDRLIQKIYSNSPLNTSVLRKVLVDANPKVITGNPQQRVKGGIALVVPDHSEVLRSTLASHLTAGQDTSDYNPSARENQARKQWVRFP